MSFQRGRGSNQHQDKPATVRHAPIGPGAQHRAASAVHSIWDLDDPADDEDGLDLLDAWDDPAQWDDDDPYPVWLDGANLGTGDDRDQAGYDVFGVTADGWDRDGLHHETGDEYSPEGLTRHGWRRDGTHAWTGSDRDPSGFDRWGYDRDGRHRTDLV